MSEYTPQHKARLRWACRRGMLELDVLLMPFMDAGYDALTDSQKATFERLLSCDDPDLFAWFMGHQQCQDKPLDDMIKIVLASGKI